MKISLAKKWTAILCVGVAIYTLTGCELSSQSNNSNGINEITVPSIQEHNGTDKQAMSIAPTNNDPKAEIIESEVDNTFQPQESSFTIRKPKKQMEIAQEEITSIDTIKVSRLEAGQVFDYEFSLPQDIEAILAWYKSLELKVAAFSDGEQKPNEKEGGSEQYTVYYKDGTEKTFLYYGGDKYIWSLTNDVWYIITD